MNSQIKKMRSVSQLERIAEVNLPSRFGDFRLIGFEGPDGEEWMACVKGDVEGEKGVPCRLHSECFTGDVLGSYRCDCRDQLEAALTLIGRSERGIVLYLPQEGRGIGLLNKLKAYALQDEGLDTVEANHALGFEDDLRDYTLASEMLHQLGVESVCILTNNPKKIAGIQQYGVQVDGVIPIRMTPNEHNTRYLDTKRTKSGHLL
ncbi:MAG: GTP cyclohydrolase II [Myxococcota bacterium]|nr:GTP cyclohydrolase II [Myxococcota bacterium]